MNGDSMKKWGKKYNGISKLPLSNKSYFSGYSIECGWTWSIKMNNLRCLCHE